MKTAFESPVALRCLLPGLFAAVLLAGCSKNADDCSGPEQEENTSATRATSAGAVPDTEEARPAGTFHRNGETNGGGTGGSISDDGDDEADGEGNKKNRARQ